MTGHQSTPHVRRDSLAGHNMSPLTIGEITQDVLPIIVNAREPFEFADNRRAGEFRDAMSDGELSREARILSLAECENPDEGHEVIFSAFLALGGVESEYDPARWELLSEGYPANRGW